MNSVIEVQNVSKRFDREVLAGIDLSLAEGRTLGLIGRNGAGKTTLIKIILGFLRANSGSIKIFGRERGHTMGLIGYLPETPDYHLLFSGKEYLSHLAHMAGVGDVKRRVAEVLDVVSMTDGASQRMNHYSKGMLQRIGVAQAILLDPPLIILDEPLPGLDPAGQKDLRDTIVKLQERNASILLCSHLLAEVEKICNDVAIIHHGRIISHGDIDNILVNHNQYQLKLEGISGTAIEELSGPFKLTQPRDKPAHLRAHD